MRRDLWGASIAILATLAGTCALIVLLVSLAPAQAAPAATNRFVATGGTDTGSCTEQAPCRTIQYALSQADDGDTVVIAVGTYAGTVQVDKSIALDGGWLALYNPFQGYTWLRGECDPSLTILDAEGSGRVIETDQPVALTIHCLTITGGDATGQGGGISDQDAGGGVYASGATQVVVSNAVISGNVAGSGTAAGGGLYAYDTRLVMSNTLVADNTAYDGGGMYIIVATGSRIQDSRFIGNTATQRGGAAIYDSNWVQVVGSEFLSNTAGYCGGMGLVLSDGATIRASRFDGNESGGAGGGLCLDFSSSTAIVSNTLFSNTAVHGGAIYLYSSSDTWLANNFVVENEITGSEGAGILLDASSADLAHNTLARNRSLSGDAAGVALANGATAALTGTLLSDHAVGVEASAGTTVSLKATLWWLCDTIVTGEGAIDNAGPNVYGDPAFVDPDAGDYHIGPDSAAINAGVDAGLTTDFDGEPRLGAPDIGADEYLIHVYLPLTMRNF